MIIDNGFKDFQLTTEMVEDLKALKHHAAYSVYLSLLKKKFIEDYNRLRKCDPQDIAYLNGRLDGYDFAINVIQQEIDQNTNEGAV